MTQPSETLRFAEMCHILSSLSSDTIGNAVFASHKFLSGSLLYSCQRIGDRKASIRNGFQISKSITSILDSCRGDDGTTIQANSTWVKTNRTTGTTVINRCSIDPVNDLGRLFAEECRFRGLNVSVVPGCYTVDAVNLYLCKSGRSPKLYSAEALIMPRTINSIQAVQLEGFLNCNAIV